MLGILYDNGEVCLAGDRKGLTNKDHFKILLSFADLYKKVTNLLVERTSAGDNALKLEKEIKNSFGIAYLSLMAGGNSKYAEIANEYRNHIKDDRFVFEIDENSDRWELSIIKEPKTITSLLGMISYCMIMISMEIQKDPIYSLKLADILNRL